MEDAKYLHLLLNELHFYYLWLILDGVFFC